MPISPVGLLPLITSGNTAETKPAGFRSLQIASSGLSAQLQRMEVIATNIANAETTRIGEAGSGPYKRRVVRIEEMNAQGSAPALPPLPPTQPDEGIAPTDPTSGLAGVQVASVEEDQTPGPLVYDPAHPDADSNGYVRYPNVRVTDEVADLMDARRIYEANATVFQAAKLLLHRALDI